MKTFFLLAISWLLTCPIVPAKESLTPQLSEQFGEVFDVTIEFIEKPRTYYAQNLVKADWFAKVKAVNGKALKDPVVIEYRCAGQKFKKGETMTLRAFEDIESFGWNREFDGVVRQFDYMMSHFIRVRTLKKAERNGAIQSTKKIDKKAKKSKRSSKSG